MAMANMAEMASTSTTLIVSSIMPEMTMPAMVSNTDNTMMSATMASSMEGMMMASQIMNSPQAGIATSMAQIKDMCELSGMQRMCIDRSAIVVGVSATLLAVASLAVLFRLIARRLSAMSFWWDDVAILAALAFSYACSALTFLSAKHGVGRHFETVPQDSVNLLFKTTVAYQIIYCICITLIKISILLFYYRLFGIQGNFRLTIYVVLSLVCAWCVAITLVDIFQCTPIQAAWIRPYPDSKCLDQNATLLGTAITNVLLDFVILILPLAPIWNLALSLRQKITLTAIFLLGAFICAAAIVRVWSILNIDQTDVTWSYARPLTWSAVEISVAIICACLPTLQPLVRITFGRCISHTTSSLGNNRRRRNALGDMSKRSDEDSESGASNAMICEKLPRPGACHTRKAGRGEVRGGRRPGPSLQGGKPRRTSSNQLFYALEKTGGVMVGKHEVVTNVWASNEDLSDTSGTGVAAGLVRSNSRNRRENSIGERGGNSAGDSNDGNVWSQGIRVKQEIELETGRAVSGNQNYMIASR